MTDTMKIDLKYLSEERSRHGRVVVYVRIGTARIRIRARAGTPQFVEEYRDAVKSLLAGAPRHTAKTAAARQPEGTLGWLIETYFRESIEFQRMRPTGQTRRRTRLTALAASLGEKPAIIPTANIMAGLAKRADKPGAANAWLKDIKALYTWAMASGRVASNPAAGIGKIKYRATSRHCWTLDEIAQFLRHHRGNDRAWLACLFLLVTALRREDATRVGRQHIKNGRLRFTASKNAAVRSVSLPAFVLDLIGPVEPGGTLAILTNNNGEAFGSGAAFGNWLRDRCNEAGLQHCTAHGLRHALATIGAEHGCSEHEIMEMLADRDAGQARTYTQTARAESLSDSGIGKVIGAIQNAINSVAPAEANSKGATETPANALKSLKGK